MSKKILYIDMDNVLVDFLVDDRKKNGVDRFAGEFIFLAKILFRIGLRSSSLCETKKSEKWYACDQGMFVRSS